MAKPMSNREWSRFEALARRFCELRAEHHDRKAAGQLGVESDAVMVGMLGWLEQHLDRMRAGKIVRAKSRGLLYLNQTSAAAKPASAKGISAS